MYIYIRYGKFIKIYTYMNKYWCWVIDLAYFNICPTNMTTLPNRKTCVIFFWQWVILRVSVSWWDGQKFLSYWLRSQINVGRIEDYTGYESSVLHVAYIASSLWTWYSHRKLAHHGDNQKNASTELCEACRYTCPGWIKPLTILPPDGSMMFSGLGHGGIVATVVGKMYV